MFTYAETKKQNSNSFSFDKTNDKKLNPVHQKFSNLQSGKTLQRKCACNGSHNGNGECEECKKKKLSLQRKEANSLQTKLTINTPGDAYEKEADAMADKVMRMSIPENVNLKHNEQEKIQRKESSNNDNLSTALPIVNEVINSPGKPLDDETRAFMEPRFGYDFSKVRIHDDNKAAESARAVNAMAYTVGNNIVFNKTQYLSQNQTEKKLLAHELTHVVQQDQNKKTSSENSSIAPDQGHTFIQRKLHLYSTKEAKAFQYFLTSNDAANYQTKQVGKILEVSLKTSSPATVDDIFRVNILNTIISHPIQTLLIRGYDMDAEVEPHRLFKDGKEIMSGVKITLRQMAGHILGAGGVTISSESLALASEPKFKGPVTPVSNETWIFYSTPSSLAHEFGHAFLLFSGTPSGHGQKIPKTAGIKAPDGSLFDGEVNVFIKDFVSEKQTVFLDESSVHFSPTAIRNWPEPPDFKQTFKGTWLEFLSKYPGSTAKQEIKGKSKILKICVATADTFCMP